MRVIMLADVKGIGKKGQIVEVKDGYASNFLIPRKLAVKETTKSVEILDKQNAEAEAKRLAQEKEAKEVAKKLETITCEFQANCGTDGRMFGAISYKQVEQYLKDKHNVIIDKRKILSKVPVDRLGYTKLDVELFKGVKGVITVHVSEKK
ncbi:MAG: 50S ribosomal protein L9 [Bacilli bacterium]|nr:50S ribosomal protein L9 [Bacilli bacterium]